MRAPIQVAAAAFEASDVTGCVAERKVRCARFGPGLWPRPRRQARKVGIDGPVTGCLEGRFRQGVNLRTPTLEAARGACG